MQEVIVHEGPRTAFAGSPIPKPGPDQIVIRVDVAGCNPKDYKTYWFPEPLNQGNDVAGYVHEVGSNVVEFKAGDAAFALHEVGAKHGTHAEYCVTWAYTTAHLPRGVSMEEAATIPLAATSAALGLYRGLQVPAPWQSPSQLPRPLLIYGASSAVGAFAVKLALLSRIHPIIAISGPSGVTLLSDLLEPAQGDILLNYQDYRTTSDLVTEIGKACPQPLYGALDAISQEQSPEVVFAALDAFSGSNDAPRLVTLLPYPEDVLTQRKHVNEPYLVVAADVHNGRDSKAGGQEFGCVMFRMFARWLGEGNLSGHPFEVRPGGLRGVQGALEDLRDGKVRGKKLLVKVQDT
ncbi:MAG: hypothetical protein LQ344_007976 [Seirophora lacunosa]|nr:MAG: hypothetical protein LQ344_007976 [Seirophora lacunosa]